MKLQVKQLDTATTNTIAVALEMLAEYSRQADDTTIDKYLELAATFRHCIFLQISEGYDAPIDDVQVLGNEKGGQE